MRQAILLDLDGVILKNHPVHQLVTNRCHAYVKIITKTKTPEILNKYLYETTGHTVLGLQKLGYDATITTFNKFVYNSIDPNIFSTKKNDNTKILIDLKKKCHEKKTDLYIFSNAPDSYVHKVLTHMDLSLKNISTLSEITNSFLKPDTICYKLVEKWLKVDKITFVDDKVGNILPVINSPKWENYWFADNLAESVYNNLNIINDLRDIKI